MAGQLGLSVCSSTTPRRSPRRSASRAAAAATSPTSMPARRTSLRESRLLPLGARALHAARLHRSCRAARHRLAREAPRPAVLRRLERRRSSRCCWPNAPRARSTMAAVQGRIVRSRSDGFALDTTAAARGRRLVVATGGLSIPKIGASDLGYRARPAIRASRSSSRGRRWCRYLLWAATGSASQHLAGSRCRSASMPAAAPDGRVQRGPALHASRPERPGRPAGLDLLACRPGDRDRSRPRPTTCASTFWPREVDAAPARRRCWQKCCRVGSRNPGSTGRRSDRPVAEMRDRELAELAAGLKRWSVAPDGHRGLSQGRGHRRRRRHPRLDSRTLKAAAFPGFTSSARSSTSPAGSAATTSSGPGPARRHVPAVWRRSCPTGRSGL